MVCVVSGRQVDAASTLGELEGQWLAQVYKNNTIEAACYAVEHKLKKIKAAEEAQAAAAAAPPS